MASSRTTLLLETLIERQVASSAQLFRIAYQPESLESELLESDLEYLQAGGVVGAVDLEGHSFFLPTFAAGLQVRRKVKTPVSSYEIAVRAFHSELAAQVKEGGGEWYDQPRKQLNTKALPRHVRAFKSDDKVALVVVDPSFVMAELLAGLAVGEVLALSYQCTNCLGWQIPNCRAIRARDLL